jgi:serine O-acetyltransferase
MHRVCGDPASSAMTTHRTTSNSAAFDAQPQWKRERKRWFTWDPPRSLIASLRDYERASPRRFGLLARQSAMLRHRFWSAVTGADIPLGTSMGGGISMPHPNGIVVFPGIVIGPNCHLSEQVTLGTREGRHGGPRLGAGVFVGPGAKVLGPVVIGDGAVIEPNSVVLQDVPPGCIAMGIPAVLLGRASRSPPSRAPG